MELIENLLDERGLPKKTIADIIGRSRAAATHLFNGSRKLSADEATKIAKFFNVPVTKILGEDASNLSASGEIDRALLKAAMNFIIDVMLAEKIKLSDDEKTDAAIDLYTLKLEELKSGGSKEFNKATAKYIIDNAVKNRA